MSTPFERLIQVLGDAMQLPRERRRGFIEKACDDDAGLRGEALELLQQAESSSLAAVTEHLEARIARTVSQVSRATLPERIGPYRIVEILGEGGMGVVYRAKQEEPIRRAVALKVLRLGVAGPRVVARFEAERQSLARMDHPAIAHIYEAGTTDDHLPYLAMELVHGQPITSWCDRHQLDLAGRLALFVEVCRGVQHAHQKGVIHRDLKPSNILVAELDGRPQPKIIDFGIARLVESESSVETLHTEFGSVMGTLEYMSPEQASGRNEDVDTRSDIYSLGVVLYELVAGDLPFQSKVLRGSGVLGAQKILQTTDPPAPSRRLITGTMEVGEVARARATNPRALQRQVRGDVDWVVMRAIEKDPARRYSSANLFAEDIQRILRHEAVEAGPPSRRYRLSRFARRHRVAVATTSVILFTLAAGVVVSTVGFLRARRAQSTAEQQAKRAELINRFLMDMFASVRPSEAKGRVITVREILDASAERLVQEQPFADNQEINADVHHAIGDSYAAIGEYERGLSFLARALQWRRELHGSDSDPVLSTLDRIGNIHWTRGELQASLDVAQEVLAIRERTVGRLHKDYSGALTNVANTYADLGDAARAEGMLREVLTIDRQVLGAEAEDLAFTLNNLATALVDQRKYGEAIPLHRESVRLRHKHFGNPSAEVSIALTNLGFALEQNGDLAEADSVLHAALEMSRVVFGDEHIRTAVPRQRLAGLLLKQGSNAAAESLLQQALRTFVEVAGDQSLRAASCRAMLGELWLRQGRESEGERLLENAWAILSESQGVNRERARGLATLLAAHYQATDKTRANLWRGRSTVVLAKSGSPP